jgi:ABC-type sugar transport system substrate-binding protein
MRRKITAAVLAAVVALSMSVPAAFAAENVAVGVQVQNQNGPNQTAGDGGQNNQANQQQQNQSCEVTNNTAASNQGQSNTQSQSVNQSGNTGGQNNQANQQRQNRASCGDTTSYHDNWSHGVLNFG